VVASLPNYHSVVEATRRRLPAAERRARIAEAATKVFAERGYADASMAEIASRAGVVASVIYDHYGSKRELAVELLEQHGAAIVERTITGVTADDPRELVRRSIELLFEFMEEDPFIWRFLFRDPPTDPEIAEVHRRVHDLAAEGIADMIRRTVPPQPLFGGIPYERATLMIARASQQSNQGLARWWFENRQVPREEVVEVAFRVLWDGARGMLEDPEIRASPG
jgi:AcrR family transcriptional regulator